MSSSIVVPSTFSASKVTLSALKVMDSGAKQAYLNYDSRPLLMQVGSLETPFGLSVFDKAPGQPKYTVELKLRGHDDPANHPKVAQIFNAMNALDEYMIEQGVKNCRQWFKADAPKEMVKMMYTPSVRYSRDAEGNLKPYPPTLKIQLRKKNDEFEADVYDESKRSLKDVPLEDVIVKGARLTILIQCNGVWFAGGKFGLSWKAVQVRADSVPDRIRGFAFVDEDGGAPGDCPAARPVEKPHFANFSAAPARPAPVAAAVASSNQFANLADEEEDEVDDEEALAEPPAVAEEPIPVPKKTTKVSIKKPVVLNKK
jgi:hypothetical protein